MSELDPRQRAETLVVKIAQDIQTLNELTEKEAPKKDIDPALKSMERGFNQAATALCDAGYETAVGDIHFGNEAYYKSLFFKSTATNMLDSEGADPNRPMNPLVRKVMEQVAGQARVSPPNIEKIVAEIPSPFRELAIAFNGADQIHHELRFLKMRSAIDGLRGLRAPDRPPA